MIDIYKKGWDKNNYIQKLTFVYFKTQFISFRKRIKNIVFNGKKNNKV